MALLAELIQSPYALQGLGFAILAVLVSVFWQDLADEIPYSRIPLVGKNGLDIFNNKARARFTSNARELILEGFSKGRDIFQIISAVRPLVVLHHKYIDEVKNNPNFDFQGATERNFFDNRIPGFEPFHSGEGGKVTVDLVRTKLTQALGSLTIPLSQESAAAVKDIFPPTTEWTPYNFSEKIPFVVARISTRAFLGEKLAKNEDWINISVNYTIDAFNASRELRQWPTILRPVVHHFLTTTQKIRSHLAKGKAIIDEELERRKLIREGKLAAEDEPRPQDTLDWFDSLSKSLNRPVNLSHGQMSLSLAAIHTTSNLLTNVMYDLAAYPEYIQPLRDEIKVVTDEDGSLKKTSLLKMKLMDSVIKESQRLHPVSMASLNRLTTKKTTLSDGTIIPKGAMIAVSAHVNRDEEVYPQADTYDGYRFFKMRQEPGNEQRHQLVTTTRESFGFGHGVHACPGRFFAANESKIFLIHLLLKYDWKLSPKHESAGRPPNFDHGLESIADPTVELLFRSRQPEVDLAVLGE